MKSEQDIEERLRKLQAQYRLSSDMYDPVTQARMQELNWVLKDESAKEIVKNCQNCEYELCPMDEYPCIRCEYYSLWERNEKYISHDG